MKESEVNVLNPAEAIEYQSLLFQSYRPYLSNCGRDNIIAVGAEDAGGIPCGLTLALTGMDQNGKLNEDWTLLSVFVKDTRRREGIGHSLWRRLGEELERRGCRRIRVQAVLRETALEAVEPYLSAMGFSAPERIAKIFTFSPDSMNRGKSPFVGGSLAGVFQPDERFRFLPFDELTEAHWKELEENEGGWYPLFVSPLIGKEQLNQKCTVFALDSENGRLAGWITGLNVNDNTRILYRAFFTREEYRDTPVGFFIFTQAIKNHLREFPDRGGLASIPTDNDRAMRFSTLFFRDSCDHISYEIESEYRFHSTSSETGDLLK
jgi:GNAT superfamily N-acetyltransferase